jgi:uncharacterized protein (DUF58 family)
MPKVKEILKKVRKLEIKTNKPVEGLIAGNYRSVFKGSGIEFSEVREYVPGDDIRSIDWNVTARLNAPFVKEFIEERNLSVYIVFDVSGSGEYGSGKSKKDQGYEIAASIMFAALRNNDSVGLCLFSDHVEKFIPKRPGKKHVLRMLRELVYCEPASRGTDVEKSLAYLARIVKKRSVIFVLSDYLAGDFEKPLKHLKNRHDVILINLSDITEQDIPDIGYALIEDEETGEQILVNTSDKAFRAAYLKNSAERTGALEKRMKKLKTDLINVRTDEAFSVPLARFLRMREKRMTR